jgi:hypothetical protein
LESRLQPVIFFQTEDRLKPGLQLFPNLTPHSSHPPDFEFLKQAVDSQFHSGLPILRSFFTQVPAILDFPPDGNSGRHQSDTKATSGRH